MLRSKRLGAWCGGVALLTALTITTEASAQVVVVERRRARPVYVRRLRVPEGYHLEERPRTGLIVSGAVLTGVGGAFLAGAVLDSKQEGYWDHGDSAAAIAGGIFLALGLPLLIIGATSHRLVLVRDAYLAPTIGPRMAGASFGLSF